MRRVNFLGLLQDIVQELVHLGGLESVLGVKIPLSLITKVGMLVLIAIEAYFCLHLNRLSSILTRETEPPSFPWIGVYTDPLSKLVTLMSSAGVPAGVVAWLRGEDVGSPHPDNF